MDLKKQALKLHKDNRGKIEVALKVPLESKEDLTLAYTPGVAEPCKEIARDVSKAYEYTNKGNLVAIVTDGSAVLGLGNIGAEGGYPVMEGKAVLFKKFAGIDAFPLCVRTQDVDEIVTIVKNLEPTFGAINMEDIAAPRCFEIEERLIAEMGIPVMHDDQHGTAVVVLAGLINALKVVGKKISDVRIVFNGAGAAGTAVAEILFDYGAGDVIVCDTKGILYPGREGMNEYKEKLAAVTNKTKMRGSLADALRAADVFIGVSGPDVVTAEMVRAMNAEPIIFAMANPVPEIMPVEAKAAGARVVATGRSDFPNQINNVLAYPGIFRAALDLKLPKITQAMKIAAAEAIADLIPASKLNADYIIPDVFNEQVVPAIVKRITALVA